MAAENSLSEEKIISHQRMNHRTQKEEEAIESKGMNKNCLSICLWDLMLEKNYQVNLKNCFKKDNYVVYITLKQNKRKYS